MYFLEEARLDDAFEVFHCSGGLGASSGGLPESSGGLEVLRSIAELVSSTKKAPKLLAEEVILALCAEQPCVLGLLTELFQRSVGVVRKDYLQPMIRDKRLRYLYPMRAPDSRRGCPHCGPSRSRSGTLHHRLAVTGWPGRWCPGLHGFEYGQQFGKSDFSNRAVAQRRGDVLFQPQQGFGGMAFGPAAGGLDSVPFTGDGLKAVGGGFGLLLLGCLAGLPRVGAFCQQGTASFRLACAWARLVSG